MRVMHIGNTTNDVRILHMRKDPSYSAEVERFEIPPIRTDVIDLMKRLEEFIYDTCGMKDKLI